MSESDRSVLSSTISWGRLRTAAVLGLVALLSSSVGGEFRIELWGLKLEGPSAPITMWAVCFLVMILAINMLFPEHGTYDSLAPILHSFCEIPR